MRLAGLSRAAALRVVSARLSAAGVPGPGRDARLLLRHVTGLDAAALLRDDAACLTAEEAVRLEAATQARAARRPLAQITGTRAFMGRAFTVTSDTLDPRPETELLVDCALQGPAPARFADLGTGTGCILVSLLAQWPTAEGIGTDLSAEALAVAEANAVRHGVADRALFLRTSWCDGLSAGLDLIVSNPPYIAAEEHARLEPEVRAYEPRGALVPDPDPGRDGLGAYRAIAAAAVAPRCLRPGGRLILEIGATQSAAVSAILAEAGFDQILCHRDLEGRDRVITAQRASFSNAEA
ncbi:MAG: peptide chain release factor N(5)-glutamine methyltransferase [Pseudomonadota bacterium]